MELELVGAGVEEVGPLNRPENVQWWIVWTILASSFLRTSGFPENLEQ